jgi:LysR family nitrogen assimilation transcriptional regulator
MELKQLKYFIKIVDCRSITAAANALYVSQPALSQHIHNLEEALGTRLLDRTASGVTPTAAGETLYRSAVAILRATMEAESSVRSEVEAPRGRVAIGMPSSTARAIAIPLLEKTAARFPGIMLELEETPSADLEALVMQGRLDIALSTASMRCRGVKARALVEERLFVLAHRDLNLAPNGIALKELVELPMILPPVPNSVRTRLEEALHTHRLSCNLIAESSSTTIIVAAVKSKLCVTVLPLSSVPLTAGYEEITSVSLVDAPISRRIYLSTSELAPLSLAAEKVSTLIQEVIIEAIDTGHWKGAAYLPQRRRENAALRFPSQNAAMAETPKAGAKSSRRMRGP